jgi:hypothetical protein
VQSKAELITAVQQIGSALQCDGRKRTWLFLPRPAFLSAEARLLTKADAGRGSG